MNEDSFEVCNAPHHAGNVPLIFTLAWPETALWCPTCGARYRVSQAKRVAATPQEYDRRRKLQTDTARYLFAVYAGNHAWVRFGRRLMMSKNLSRAIRDENAEILKNWKYEEPAPCAMQL